MMDWQPISTAPKDGTPVLLFTPGKGRWIAKWKKSKSVWRVVHPGSVKKQKEGPTHWMPLPDPPAKDSTVMTDEELIEFYCKPEIPIGEKNHRFARLIALADIGARVKPFMDAVVEEKRLKKTVNDWMDAQAKQLQLAQNNMAPAWRDYEAAAKNREAEFDKLYSALPPPQAIGEK